ncbi:papain family cysteine protease (macronuclear) [Tetrahymena thermophila SB210]|uniref:Papain family cysteine protease n=1 Tax=Tetrahymena thermophila (strain SB210) TaxID=312017 RepID=Q23H03_TETTS|nr:papain family cysteine protease [Tetrahymena thermophila SB210]EAR95844.1 papain family cysteine protease [Tetrahymena thermophila SB210]|eukprot:XP_001016089.1 papain family cysteine protease [Tetrahymena thermophila SB210]
MVFFENLQKIKEHNSNPNNTYSTHLNQFSDMNKVEFTEKILMKQDLVDHLMNGISQEATNYYINNENQLNSKSLTLAASID